MSEGTFDLAEVRSHFPLLQDYLYLNTGSAGPRPLEVAKAMEEWQGCYETAGLTTAAAQALCVEAKEGLRRRLASLLGAEAEEVAITANTTEGINIVAAGLDLGPGDRVITTELEHPSGLLPLYGLARRRGVQVEVVRLSAEPSLALAEMERLLRQPARLVCLSHVTYSTGTVMPIAEVARLVHGVGGLLLADGAQAAGQVPVDVRALDCDFYAISGQKWLLGPDGTGGLYVRQGLLDSLTPSHLGWVSIRSYDLEGGFELHPSAHRYEVSTISYVSLVGLSAALDFREALGAGPTYERIVALGRQARAALATLPRVELIGPNEARGQAGLVCFRVGDRSPEEAVKALLERHRIVCRYIPHPPCLRVCFHFFNSEEEVGRLVEAVAEL